VHRVDGSARGSAGGGQQQRRRLAEPGCRRHVQRFPTALLPGTCIDPGRRKQRLDRRQVVVLSGVVQRRRPAAVGGVDRRAGQQQRVAYGGVPRLCREREHGHAAVAPAAAVLVPGARVRVRAALQQQPDRWQLPVRRGECDGLVAVVVCCMDISAGREERVDRRQPPEPGGKVERHQPAAGDRLVGGHTLVLHDHLGERRRPLLVVLGGCEMQRRDPAADGSAALRIALQGVELAAAGRADHVERCVSLAARLGKRPQLDCGACASAPCSGAGTAADAGAAAAVAAVTAAFAARCCHLCD